MTAIEEYTEGLLKHLASNQDNPEAAEAIKQFIGEYKNIISQPPTIFISGEMINNGGAKDVVATLIQRMGAKQ